MLCDPLCFLTPIKLAIEFDVRRHTRAPDSASLANHTHTYADEKGIILRRDLRWRTSLTQLCSLVLSSV